MEYTTWIIFLVSFNYGLTVPVNSQVNEDDYYGDSAEMWSNFCEQNSFPPAPDSNCCGVDSSSTDYIVGGNDTQLEQYPWLLLIEYRNKENRTLTLCGGFLISSRYVLTAAHCTTGGVLKIGTPVGVRLGEYDLKNEGPDCKKSPDNKTVCNEGALKIPIENIIVHPEYEQNELATKCDIALIRLKDKAPYTKFIRPICLPTKDVADEVRNEELVLYTAGWGAVKQYKALDYNGWSIYNVYSNTKKHVDLVLKDRRECQEKFKFVNEKHLCAGGVEGKDSCRGDSGGPLMRIVDDIYEAVGMVSFGTKLCASKTPGVYTHLYHYRDWIFNNIKE